MSIRFLALDIWVTFWDLPRAVSCFWHCENTKTEGICFTKTYILPRFFSKRPLIGFLVRIHSRNYIVRLRGIAKSTLAWRVCWGASYLSVSKIHLVLELMYLYYYFHSIWQQNTNYGRQPVQLWSNLLWFFDEKRCDIQNVETALVCLGLKQASG